jgi:NarL family two-component system response regulator LiaR
MFARSFDGKVSEQMNQRANRDTHKENLMGMSNPIRVMIVDDHDMVRKGLAIFLNVSADLELVAEARDGREALRLCEQVQPDVVLMDLMMPKMDGTTITRLIRERWSEVQVVVLTSFQEQELVREALQAGAIGYLLKNATVDDLSEAIRAAHAGQLTLASEVAQELIQGPSREPTPNGTVEGLTSSESASHPTAQLIVGDILSKVGVSNGSDAAMQSFDKLCLGV